jgi:hypothetical protein
MSKFNIHDHITKITVSSRFIKGQIPFDEVIKMCKQQLAHELPLEFVNVETYDNKPYNNNIISTSIAKVDMYVITKEMFNNIHQYSSMLVDLERREEEVKKKEKEFKKLKNDLKHINELSKNVNQLFKGI